MTAERPWMKFYPQDWRADEMLRNCSLAGRGLWVEMLAIMHRSERYGYLLINGKPPSERALAVQAGATVDEVRTGLAELEAEGVFSRDSEGLIYSRRMIRDDIKHRKASTFGKRGVRAKARKDKEETATLEGTHEGTHKATLATTHEGTHQLRGQSPDTPSISSQVKGQGAKQPIPQGFDPAPFGEGTECRRIVDGWSRIEFERQLERFRAHHERDGSRFSNWQAAWKTWVLNSVEFARRNGGGADHRQHGRSGDLVEDILARAEREESG